MAHMCFAEIVEQDLRDKGLAQLTKMLIKEQRWVTIDQENPMI